MKGLVAQQVLNHNKSNLPWDYNCSNDDEDDYVGNGDGDGEGLQWEVEKRLSIRIIEVGPSPASSTGDGEKELFVNQTHRFSKQMYQIYDIYVFSQVSRKF